MNILADELALKHRMVFIGTPIDEGTAQRVVAALLVLSAEDPAAPVDLYINSAGGNILDGLAIYDAIQAVQAPVATFCVGCALSMGAVLLAAGTPGLRYATPNAHIMVHLPATPVGPGGGSLEVVQRTHRLMDSLARTLAEILARHTGQSRRRVWADMRRGRWFTAKEALRYGFIDGIIEPRREAARG
jgi:ATP-dependent Clp protease protease subunit